MADLPKPNSSAHGKACAVKGVEAAIMAQDAGTLPLLA